MTDHPVLQSQGLTKRYGNVTVLDGCSLSFEAGSIHALLGANGAGKSTLVRTFAGLVAPSAGNMRLDGREYAPGNKRAAERAGVEIVQQELNLIPTLSVAENLQLARLPSTAGVIDWRQLHQHATRALARVGLNDLPPGTRLGELGVGTQQMVEIAGALDRQCRVLILDEPTAALTASESQTLFTWLETLRQQGVGILYISHRLDEVKRLADRLSILRDGRLVGTYDTEDLTTQGMVELMSGDAVSSIAGNDSRETANDVLLRVDSLSGGPIEDVSFEVHRGECLGIAGLVGSGRTELLRLIFGADVASNGSVRMGAAGHDGVAAAGSGQRKRFRHPAEAVRAGIAMVTEDRKANGLLLTKSIRTNTTLASMWSRFSRWGVARAASEKVEVDVQRRSMEVRCENDEQPVGTLSGGNQQKVAIAKWLVRDAEVYLFDEPTRGIDVAARRRIYGLFRTLAEQGKGMVVVSSDTDELIEVCDRILVLSNGRLVETFERGDWSADRITQASFSGYMK
ncbi:MAG: sugar ABC transporter ATP-binding protein [Planctomycetota bacterium]